MRRLLLLLFILLMPFVVLANQQQAGQQPLEPVTLQLKWLYQFQFAGYIAAKEKGFYRDVGLDVTIKQRTPDINVIDEVVESHAHYGIGGMGIYAHYANGTPIKALAAIFQHDALVFISKAESGIVSPYEIAGKRVMFDATTGNDAVLRILLDDAGLELSDITVVPQDFGIENLISGKVDVMSGYITDQPYSIRQSGEEINIINPHNYGFDFYGDLLFSSVRELKNHPGRAERMLQASLKGWEYALEHPEEIIQIIKNQYGSTLSIEQLRYEARETRKLIVPEVIPLGTLNTPRLRRIADLYTKLDVAPTISDKTLSHFVYRKSETILSADVDRWLSENPVIRVGIDRDFAPYEWINEDGDYVGLAADYIRLLEEKLGVTFEIVHDKPWHEIMRMAEEGELDMLSCLNQTDKREEHLSFTEPYVSNPIVIVNANRNGYVGSLDNLKGKTVAVEKGYFTHETLRSDYPEITLLAADSTEQALEKVAAGEADAYIGDAAYANYAVKKNDLLNLQFAGQTPDTTAYRIGVHKSNPELLAAINMVLNNLSEAERKEIEDQWLGLSVNTGPKLETLIKIFTAVTLLFLLFSFWIYRLKQSRQALAESEEKLRDVLNASPIPQGILDHLGQVIYLNQAFNDTFGYTIADIPTLKHWWHRAFPDKTYRENIQDKWQQHTQHSDSENHYFNAVEGDVVCKDGSKRSVICNATQVDTEADKHTLVILYDISDRKLAEERLKMSGRVFNQAHEGILITDAKGLIVDVNPAFSEITGYSREEVLNKNPSFLRSDKHSRVFFQEMWTSLEENGHWQGEIWNINKNGQLFAELLTISTLVDEHGETLHYLGLFSDITQSKEQQQALEMMAHYDMLTQLPNRTLFADRFNQAIAHSNRTNSLLAVVFLDLDGFKPVNDRYGHDVGDQLLIEIAQRIKASIREDDTASRLGGDEFVLLLNDISSISHCERLINRIRHAIELPYNVDDDTLSLSASLGITIYPLDKADADTLLRHADQAMYQAKLGGRRRHHMFDALHDQQISQKQNQFKAMQDALKADQLVLYFQPKVNMRTGKVIGVEALIRWNHPEHGLVLPGRFLPAIQGTELEIHVGNWVIEHALQQLDIWLEDGIEMEISINISSHHLQWQGFFEQIEHVLRRHPKVPANLLQLEILESSVLSDINNISNIINTCRNVLGIRISLDDFGTGYSSLTHLRHLPVDVVKIDQSFVRDIIDDPNDYTIIDGVIGLTQAFHHQVIAEGVETVEHGLMLMTMGCEMAQGYVIAKPMPAKECTQWLSEYQPNQQWLEHAQTSLNAEQTIIKLMRLQGKHWLDQIVLNLQSDPDKVDHWPLINHKKSHFMHWLEQARKQNLFNKVWRENIKLAYTELYHEANSLKYQFQEGFKDVDEKGIKGLQQRFQTIETLLQEFEQSSI
ncbi:EAL domain-containing protein [Methylophaga sp.]|uniref:EAL domain-containing protein n=1 Tax=Methylophaga sp. TaxID=2024840 RepID=UPI003F69A529